MCGDHGLHGVRRTEAGRRSRFFVVTRRGALWVFVLFTQLVARLRLRPWPAPERPRPCFNYVLEDGLASPEFERPRGFVVAREALNTVVIRGESYYQGLLGAGIWMREEVPRLYVTRSPMPPRSPEPPAAWPVRLASALIFPFAAAYLHLKTIYNNAWCAGATPIYRKWSLSPPCTDLRC